MDAPLSTPELQEPRAGAFHAAHGCPNFGLEPRVNCNGSPGAERSGRSFLFYVGLDDLYYAFRFERAFISVNRLRDRKSPFEVNAWIMDSGAFTEITTHGHYRTEPVEYAREIERWQCCGTLECAVSQDWMCEPFVTAKTGLTVRDHQRLTVERFDALRAATAAPLLPVLQGFKPHEYLEHLAMYGNALSAGARVGVGSVCKRNSHPAVIEYILRGIKRERPDLRLHGFGLKLTALQRPEIRALLYSADSMAWSLNARKNGRDAHDWREAEAYRARVEQPDESLELWN